jgi:hypothetical protein
MNNMLYEKHNVYRGKGNYIFVKPIGFLCQVSKALSIGTLKKPTWVFTMDKKPQMRDIHKIEGLDLASTLC